MLFIDDDHADDEDDDDDNDGSVLVHLVPVVCWQGEVGGALRGSARPGRGDAPLCPLKFRDAPRIL